MALIDDTPSDDTHYVSNEEANKKPAVPTWGDTWMAGFRLNSDVVNAVSLLTRPVYQADPQYELASDLRERDQMNKTKYFDLYFENFVGSQSTAETTAIMQRIQQEQRDRQVSADSGFGGMVIDTVAGMLSPTSAIPLVGPMTRAKGAWQFAKEAAILGAGAGAAQEAVLQANQETRPWSESAIGIAGQTLLSGVLGGAIGHLTAPELRSASRAISDSHISVAPESAGAAAVAGPTATELASGGQTITRGLNSNPVTRNPVSFNIQQPMETRLVNGKPSQVPIDYLQSEVARGTTVQLSDGGFRYADNDRGIATAGGFGGTVENLIQTHYDVYPQVIKELDSGFLDYRYNSVSPPQGANVRVMLNDFMKNTGGKLTKSEYKAGIAQALRNGDQHEVPQIAATAAHIRQKLFNPLLKQAQELGIIPKEVDLKGDVSWLLRDYDRDVIRKNTTEFVDQIAKHFEHGLRDEFAQELEKLKVRNTRTDELVSDLTRPADEVEKLKADFLKKREDLEETANAQHLTALEDTISELRGRARELLKNNNFDDTKAARQMLQDAKDMEETAGDPLKNLKFDRSEISRRLSNLNKSRVVLEGKQAQVLSRIERLEDLSLKSLMTVARAGQDVLNRMDRWSDKELDKQLGALKTKFAQLGEVFDRGEERMAKMIAEEPEVSKLIDLEDVQTRRADRMSAVSERIADAEDLGRTALRELIQDSLDKVMARAQKLNAKRAVRSAGLVERAKALDPAQVAERIKAIREKNLTRQQDWLDDWRQRGADNVDLTKGTVDFSAYAREQANAAKDKVMGTHIRLAQVDKAPGVRGSEIARTLNVPSNVIEKFLINDVESLMKSTLRTFAPDIEMARRFGDVNGEQMFMKLADEMNAKLEAVGHDEKLTPEVKAKRQEEINQTYGMYRQNLEGILGRLRHTRGLPDDPEGLSYRLGRTILNLNTMRFMGGVTISSIPDVGRPIMRYGLTRTFQDAFIPLITNFKETKANMSLIRQLMGGLDPAMQSRARALTDMLEESNRGSRFEKAMEYGTSRVGQIALFEYWTSGMKQLSGLVANRKFMDSLETMFADGKNIDLKEATRFLTENDIDGKLAAKMWDNLTREGGGNKVDGKWWPNTERWDPDVKRAYGSAMIREGNITIVTPGVERPLWTDRDMFMRMLSQFKSFSFSSTSKVMISGMQQRDAAIVNGVMVSLAMGALAYYVYARSVGGKIEAEMMKAKPGKWADEAINRSGVLAIFGNVQEVAGRIPAVAPYASFSGGRTTRSNGGDDLLDVLGGPSYSFASSAAKAVTGLVSRDSQGDMQKPGQGSVHQLRTLIPYQNLIGFRRLLDLLEEQVPKRPR